MFQKPTPLTTGLIIACIICYLPELIGFNVNGWLAVSPYSPYYAPWQLVTAMFAHGSIDHLAMNMVSLWWLGTMLEKMQGTVRFAIVYFVSGILGNLAFALLGSSFAVGASGAIFGLLGAVAVLLYRHRSQPFARAMLQGLGVMIAINVVNSFMPGIALEAHFGGLLAGALIEAIILAIGGNEQKYAAFRRLDA
ncbi:MAG: rhomboid family intramembrane serine protease [Coriobacteriaceae bacterium]|nr:rhomboid family intramembrane serine protease [Coriobacteriaceae bacterium]MDO4890771.1 rhomboid family intramembrane serine protease [Coriobacteriaceae bacterium]